MNGIKTCIDKFRILQPEKTRLQINAFSTEILKVEAFSDDGAVVSFRMDAVLQTDKTISVGRSSGVIAQSQYGIFQLYPREGDFIGGSVERSIAGKRVTTKDLYVRCAWWSSFQLNTYAIAIEGGVADVKIGTSVGTNGMLRILDGRIVSVNAGFVTQ